MEKSLQYLNKITLLVIALLVFSGAAAFAQPILPQPVLTSPATASSVGASGISLTWNASAGADWYYGELSTDNTFTSGVDTFSTAATTFNLPSVTTGQLYYWRIRAWSTVTSDSSDWTTPFNFTTQLGVPLLAQPSNHQHILTLSSTLTWYSVPNTALYRLQAATDTNFSSVVLNTILGSVTDTTYLFAGLSYNTKYFWRVKAFSAADSSTDYSAIFDFRTPVEVPTLSTPLNNSYAVSTSPSLVWASVAGADSYHVQIATTNTFASLVSDGYAAGLSYAVSGLANGTEYFWRVKAIGAFDSSDFSTEFKFTTSIAVPVLASPADNSFGNATNPSLSWGAVTGASGYRVQVASDVSFTTIVATDTTSSTGFAVAGLSQYTSYYWRVKSISPNDSSAYSAYFTFTTKIATPVLSTPADNSYQAALNPALSWAAVSGATTYHLQVATDNTFTALVNDSYPATNSTGLTGLSNNATYYWQVKSKNANDSSIYASYFTFTTLLATPVLSSPAAYSYGNVLNPTLSWAAVPGATEYRVQFSTDSTFAAITFDDTVSITNKAYAGLANNTNYYWRVRAQNTNNQGAFSAMRRFTTKLTIAVLTTPADGDLDKTVSLGFAWNAVSGANRYQIQVATDSGFSSIVQNVTGLTGTSTTLSGLSYWKWYYWRIKASNTSGNYGDFSGGFSFQTKLAPPTLVAPGAGATTISINPLLSWRTDTAATWYHVQLSLSNTFTTTIIDSITTDTSLYVIPVLANNTLYYWRVLDSNAVSTSDNTTRSFTTVPEIIPYPSHPLGGQLVYTLTPTLYWYINVPAPGIQYDVLYSVDPAVPLLTSTIADAGDTIHYTVPSALLPGTKYYWRVRSKYAGPIIVKYSAVDSFTTYGSPVAPTPGYPLTGNTVHTLNPVLRWYMSLNVPFYTFEYRYKPASSGSWADTVNVGSDLIDTLSSLTAGASYDWEVRTYNSDTVSSWSATQTFTVDGSTATTPGTPVLAYPVANASVYTSSPTLYWWVPGNTSGLSYSLEVRADTNFTGTPTDTAISAWYYTKTGLTSGTTYYWRARSGDGLAYSTWSVRDTFTINAPAAASMPVLSYPVDSAGVYTSGPTVFFYTNTYTVGTTYDVELYLNDTISAAAGTASGIGNTYHQFTNLLAGKTYYWRARSHNGANTSAWSSFEDFYTVGSAGTLTPIPTWPVGGVTLTDTNSVSISWYVNGFSIQALTYQMELNDVNSFGGTPTHSGITSPLTVTGLTAGTEYYYRLRSYNGNA
ncbi:MAG: fibronectin type III domain-containing protein, partial [Ignavibacteriales bacterium]|nr:fibronectin type III domain-containing protein [Ignavibacteriales bacterium]